MNQKAAILYRLGEPFAAGMFEDENDTIVERHGRGIRRYFENVCPPAEEGLLYPGVSASIWRLAGQHVFFHYSHSFVIERIDELLAHAGELESDFERKLLVRAVEELRFWRTSLVSPRYRIGGDGWTHSVLNYRRLLTGGLDEVEQRVAAMDESPLKRALSDVLAGLDHFLKRAPGRIAADVRKPVRNFYSAMRNFNFFHALDEYDSVGRFDEYMGEYYQGEVDAAAWLEELFHIVDAHDGWHYLFTGKYPNFTRLCLSALKWRRPNAGFLVSKDTPAELWDAIFDQWAKGHPSPSLYNDAVYSVVLSENPEQQATYCFGGCTELMFEGSSCVGSVDAGVNLLDIFTVSSPERLREDIKQHVAAAADEARRNAEFARRYRPQLIRTLFIDDCIENRQEYNAGGARYNASVINVAGLTDLANSLAALAGLKNRFGNDKEDVDQIAAEWAEYVFGLIRAETGRNNGPCYPAIILFTTYAMHGGYVAATPDGRADGAPLADSAGAATGTDKCGPTALLNSVARLPSHEGLGTMILNVRLSHEMTRSSVSRDKLCALIRGFFQQGGMQFQPTLVDQELLQRAHETPDAYPELIVRIGGYSEYFQRLNPELRMEVIKRIEHDS